MKYLTFLQGDQIVSLKGIRNIRKCPMAFSSRNPCIEFAYSHGPTVHVEFKDEDESTAAYVELLIQMAAYDITPGESSQWG